MDRQKRNAEEKEARSLKARAYELFSQGKHSDLQIAKILGTNYTQTQMLKISYKNAHLSDN